MILKGKMQTTNSSTGTIPTSASHDSVTNDLRPEKEPVTSTALPDQDGREGYESCECLGTFEEDVMMGNGAEWEKCVCNR